MYNEFMDNPKHHIHNLLELNYLLPSGTIVTLSTIGHFGILSSTQHKFFVFIRRNYTGRTWKIQTILNQLEITSELISRAH